MFARNAEIKGYYKRAKLAVGMEKGWKEAMSSKGRLLVVEANYMYAAEHGASDDMIYQAS